jgi:hypothetical protein
MDRKAGVGSGVKSRRRQRASVRILPEACDSVGLMEPLRTSPPDHYEINSRFLRDVSLRYPWRLIG